MSEISSKTIIEVVNHLIGPVIPLGSCHEDQKRHENLKVMIDLVNDLLESVELVAERKGIEFSVCKMRFDAQSALQEWRDWINEVLEE